METNKNFDAPELKLHFLDYWRIIRIRKTVILAVFLLVAITTTLVTFILPPTYASTVRISVEKDATDISGLDGQRASFGFDPYWIQTQFEKLTSKMLLHQVITNLDLSRKWGEKYKEGELRLDTTYGLLKRATSVNQSRNTSLIEIKVDNDDPIEAAVIANKIAEVYRDSRLYRWRENSSKGLENLLAKYTNQNEQISILQTDLEDMRRTNDISEISETGGNAVRGIEQDTLVKLETERIQTQAEFSRVKSSYDSLTNQTRAELRKTIATVVGDPSFNQLLDQLYSAEQKLAIMTNSLGLDHVEVKSVRALLETINGQVEGKVDSSMQGMKINLDAKMAHVQAIGLAVDTAKGKNSVESQKLAPYQAKKRQLENAQYVRDRLYLRIQQEEIDFSMPKTSIVEIVDRAEPEMVPVRPRKTLNIALGCIIGLVIGIGLAFFIEYLDTSVKTIDDVERALQAPVLGVIPQNVGYLFAEGPDSPHAEAYRVLRTNILFSQKDAKLNTFTIVSGGAGEGKSTTIFNLATIFAQNGSRVLVVDSDLRRPSLHKILKVSNSIGLTNFLLKQNTLEEVIQTSPIATMDFLPSGKLPSSSMGVLSSAQMKELIRDLKRRYDYVFFDSPPIMGVSDASILASEVDCVLQVIQYRRYPQPMTIRAKQMIEKVGGNLLGIVLNNINMASDENYYYYSGYYYDYYSKNEESTPDKPDANGSVRGEEETGVEIKPKY